jgi:hypothetical protein
LQGDLRSTGRDVVSIGKGFVLNEIDYDVIFEAVQAGMTMEVNSPEDGANCQAIGQMFRVSLFPGNTASHGYYGGKKGTQFHLARYERMSSKHKPFIFFLLPILRRFNFIPMTELIDSLANKCKGKRERRASLKTLILSKFRMICRKKRSQRNIARFQQWEIPNDFAEWYLKECAKADEEGDEDGTKKPQKATGAGSSTSTRSKVTEKRAAQEEWDRDSNDFESPAEVNPPKKTTSIKKKK